MYLYQFFGVFLQQLVVTSLLLFIVALGDIWNIP
jgi:hypothetical protein